VSYQDMMVTCESCGKRFIFTVETQRRLAERGAEVVIPDRCEACTQRSEYGGRLHGRIKWFSLEKGYGFLAQDDGSEVFVHRSGLSLTPKGSLPTLDEGQEVLYEIADTPKGPQAVGVEPFAL